MSSDFVSIGELLAHLKEVNDLEERAQSLQDFVDKDNEYGRYLENGPATLMNVVSEHTGEKRECILWNVNHYLSLNRNSNVIEKASHALRQFGTGCGTAASSCGMTSLHKEIEQKLSKSVGKESAVLFPTGFTTNLGAISCLAGNKDLIIFDRECHSSIINGIRLSKAKKWISFKHNDVADLKAKLQRFGDAFENIFVIVESAYSLSGDLAPLKEITSLKKTHKFYLYVDEAHTFGIYGDKGQGYCYELGISDQVDFIISTLSKATASVGGFFAADQKYCSLIRFSDPYLFQACLTPADAAVVLAALEEIENNPSFIRRLHDKNKYMRGLLTSKGFNLGNSKSPIIPIFIEDHHKLKLVVNELYLQGIYSTPIYYPAVKMNQGRIRLIVNYAHTKEQIDYTVQVLEDICRKHQVIGNKDSDLFVINL
ncbi:aminotransferase class I/II-fold pyridoxal phosphate-dependent enzyme [Cohnella pontilimi]|uniref:Aminotransferase class I/II-fold pyridoxal phosphate-dependent enzyme n=1 Tax=Cohnella pontilimi TaxID=2564100 RepID=A0A4U0FAD3_9BACL|nr:aminotransferase class I/II-fold pyridoxal phosphate-dependent enzyme [Cohnella pontilimi]TJY41753.1 aminotransferase class I/II-fold pyridoxal phosphate-dependent enzyme [Cohnella pontilimi]